MLSMEKMVACATVMKKVINRHLPKITAAKLFMTVKPGSSAKVAAEPPAPRLRAGEQIRKFFANATIAVVCTKESFIWNPIQ